MIAWHMHRGARECCGIAPCPGVGFGRNREHRTRNLRTVMPETGLAPVKIRAVARYKMRHDTGLELGSNPRANGIGSDHRGPSDTVSDQPPHGKNASNSKSETQAKEQSEVSVEGFGPDARGPCDGTRGIVVHEDVETATHFPIKCRAELVGKNPPFLTIFFTRLFLKIRAWPTGP
jgi:hypothetical protein